MNHYIRAIGSMLILVYSTFFAMFFIDKVFVNIIYFQGMIYTQIFGIPVSFSAEKVEGHGGHTPMGRRGQPAELAPSYVFLATYADSSYITGQVIHVNGGDYITS